VCREYTLSYIEADNVEAFKPTTEAPEDLFLVVEFSVFCRRSIARLVGEISFNYASDSNVKL